MCSSDLYMYESNVTREGIEGILRMYALIMEEIPSYNGVFWQKLKKWDEVRKKLNDPGLADRLIAEFEEEKAKKVKIN